MGKNYHISFSLVLLATSALFLAGEVKCNLCKEPDHESLCKSIPEAISDPVRVVEAAINQAITKTKDVIEHRTDELNKDENSKVCEEMYDDAISDLNESISDLKRGDSGGLQASLCSAMTYYSGCDEAYEEAGQKSPFASMNVMLENLIHNCLALAYKLKFD